MLKDSFTMPEAGGFTLDNYKTILTDSVYIVATKNSIYLSLISSVVGLILSFFIAYSINEIGKKGQNRVLSILNMVSNFVGLPLYFAFVVILGNTGVFVLALRAIGINLSSVFRLYSMDGLMLLFIYFQIPLGSLMLVPAFQAIQPAWREAAELLEAPPWKFWTRIGIPVLMPSILDTFGLLFANAITAYATVILLVTTSIPLLPVKITTMFTGEMTQQKEMGAALAIWMVFLMLLVIAVCNFIKKRLCRGGQ
ncbi:ABC transporter permease subunit [Mediterraneibacter glycyrrhizinilyticus]|nr:ABC transporter permease subunit [Mediterraneibacter glycyrrhizinilyticus]MBM6855860.1 ABC transporter permease subunit [Mediterraneibacter glycyrrhizinilyticus]